MNTGGALEFCIAKKAIMMINKKAAQKKIRMFFPLSIFLPFYPSLDEKIHCIDPTE
jgi:hypothetical protein